MSDHAKHEAVPAPTEETTASDWGVAACPEAQADGVPCPEAGRHCEVCGRAQVVILQSQGH